MAERKKQVPVPRNADGSVTPLRRAAALKRAVRQFANDGTVELQATWVEAKACWELTFRDE